MKTTILIVTLNLIIGLIVNTASASDLCHGVKPMAEDFREFAMRRDLASLIPSCQEPETDQEICDCLHEMDSMLDNFNCRYARSTTEKFYCEFKGGINMQMFKMQDQED